MKKNGKEYEKFVFDLHEALLTSEKLFFQNNLIIERNKKIVDSNGIEREFDIYWEYLLGGIRYKTVIECKDYSRNVSIDKIDSLIGKLEDFPDIQGVFATKKGYQSGAEQKAKKNGIQLLVVREQNDSDWKDSEGNPYMRSIEIETKLIIPTRIVDFRPTIDKEWVIDNNIIIPECLKISVSKDKIFIENFDKKSKLSLLEIEKNLIDGERISESIVRFKEITNNSFLIYENYYLKLKEYHIDFIPEHFIEQTISMDFSEELRGVIEYLNNGIKKSIFRNGKIYDEEFLL
ncbi:restriction endonuclease [Acetoanaerobium sticklandii]|uniref:restriction endonuclease n=1 Tax=Acetoanaerobium sticklandii TaxID=1511 RepID=UPI003A908089